MNFPNINFDLVNVDALYLLSSTPLLYFNFSYYGGQIFCEIDEDWCKRFGSRCSKWDFIDLRISDSSTIDVDIRRCY